MPRFFKGTTGSLGTPRDSTKEQIGTLGISKRNNMDPKDGYGFERGTSWNLEISIDPKRNNRDPRSLGGFQKETSETQGP